MPKPRRQQVGLRPVVTFATLDSESVDSESRTVDAVFYSGAPVLRIPMFDDPFELEFEVSKKAANFDRLNAGASVIDSHGTYRGVQGILGKVEKAWIGGGQAHAKIRFSRRDDVEPIWQDVMDGIIRSVSMGTYIHQLEDVTKQGAELKRMRATAWEPYEISLVAVPADAGAQIQAMADGTAEERPCTVIYAEASAEAQEDSMKIKVRLLADSETAKKGDIVEVLESDFDEKLHSKELETPAPKYPAPTSTNTAGDDKAAQRAVDDALEADRQHADEIHRLEAHYKLDELWAQKHISKGTPIEMAIADAKDERAKRAPKTVNDLGFGDDFESSTWRVSRMEDALAARAMRKAAPEEAKQYANFGFVDAALECLSFVGKARGMHARRDAERIISTALALHTTSDFPLLLGNVLNKMLLPAYEQAQPTYRMVAAQRTFKDFRPHRFIRSGDFPVPLEVNEHGEFKYGTMGENQEIVTAATFGRILGLSRQALINDDLGAFENIASTAGRRIADFENATFFSTCITAAAGLGPDLSDTVAVYDAAHGNVTGAGALSNTLLGSALALMMAQTSLDGLKLNVVPRFLLVSPTNVVLAKTLLAAITPNQASQVNPFAGEMVAIGDANLTGTRFYALADPGQLPNYIYGYLDGNSGPRTQVREGFEIDGVEFKVALDFGVGAIDFRGGVTGAGS